MACECRQPCACQPGCSKCDRDRKNNVWVERGNNPGSENAPGICLLDTMTEAQVIDVVERDERARKDLLRVTSDPRLLEIARTTKRLTTAEEADLQQKWVNKNETPAGNPFYGIFRGQPPFAQ
jgi:hypothetical protein